MTAPDAGLVERLTEDERRILHAGVCRAHNDNAPGVYVCGPCERVGDAAVERIIAARVAAAEVRALLPIRHFAEGRAITAKAQGRDDRDWLDLLILLDRADRISTEGRQSDG